MGENVVLKVLSLFSGIGGIDLAAQWAGIETAAFCEIEPYAVQILKKRFPGVPIYAILEQLQQSNLPKMESVELTLFAEDSRMRCSRTCGVEQGERQRLYQSHTYCYKLKSNECPISV